MVGYYKKKQKDKTIYGVAFDNENWRDRNLKVRSLSKRYLVYERDYVGDEFDKLRDENQTGPIFIYTKLDLLLQDELDFFSKDQNVVDILKKILTDETENA